jgi:CubicO group peptidase (beta-lactamase class C family)
MEQAQQAYQDSVAAGVELNGKTLGQRFGRSERWGRERIAETRPIPRPPLQWQTTGLPTPDAFWYTPTAFGFPGYGGSLGFADPATGLAFGYVMNHVQEGVPDRRAATLLEAVRSAMAARARSPDSQMRPC